MELWTRSRQQEATVLERQLPEKVPFQGKAVLVVEFVQRIPAATFFCSNAVAKHLFCLSNPGHCISTSWRKNAAKAQVLGRLSAQLFEVLHCASPVLRTWARSLHV